MLPRVALGAAGTGRVAQLRKDRYFRFRLLRFFLWLHTGILVFFRSVAMALAQQFCHRSAKKTQKHVASDAPLQDRSLRKGACSSAVGKPNKLTEGVSC